MEPQKKNDQAQRLVDLAKQGQKDIQEGDPKDDLKITLWKNGFQIGEDSPELRDYNDPKNQQFMSELMSGRIPTEIRQKYQRDIGVALADKREEVFVPPPPPKYISFSGAGTGMGEEVKSTGGAVNTAATGGKPVVDASKPTTQIQFRFHNGQRATLEVNTDHKVSDLHNYIAVVAPVDGSYQLINGFPPKPLTNPNATIQEAGLLKASITQKLC